MDSKLALQPPVTKVREEPPGTDDRPPQRKRMAASQICIIKFGKVHKRLQSAYLADPLRVPKRGTVKLRSKVSIASFLDRGNFYLAQLL